VHLDVRTECGLGKRNRNSRVEVRSLSLEILVLRYVKDHIEVSCRTPVYSGLTLAGDAKARSSFDTRRDLDLEGLFLFYTPLAATGFAWCFDDLSLARTVGTGAHNAEKALLITRLAAAAARDTGFGLSSLFCAASVALTTGFQPRDSKFFFLSAGSV